MLYACHRGGIPSLTELYNFVCAYYSYRNALTLTCWLKACVLYFPPASLDLDFRLQIRKDSWGCGFPRAVCTRSEVPEIYWAVHDVPLWAHTVFPNLSNLRGFISVKDGVYKWYLIEKYICRAYETPCVPARACIKITGQRQLRCCIYLLAQTDIPALRDCWLWSLEFVPRKNISVKYRVCALLWQASASGVFKLKSSVSSILAILGAVTYICLWVHLDFSSPLVRSRIFFLLVTKRWQGWG